MVIDFSRRAGVGLLFLTAFSPLLSGAAVAVAQSATGKRSSIIHEIQSTNERLEMTANGSRIVTLDQKFPRVQVANPDLLDLTILSDKQFQLHAKRAGVTQVNVWGEDGKIYTIDVVVFGDAEELSMLLRSEFRKAQIRVIPVANGAMLSGYVDKPEDVTRIVQLAEEFYPKVISNLRVGGVQQVLLHVKVMEVSRTKMRALGFDWAQISGDNIVASSVSGLLSGVSGLTASSSSGATFNFQVVNGSSAFFGVLEALREDNLMKVLAEPTLVTVSGRPAFFNVGGEFPILVPESLGTVSIEYKKFGTQVDFVPIVLGNGKIRLEVRPRVSEIDNTRSVEISSINVPGLRVREVDTGVEMAAGQTLAIAGLVQNRIESRRRGMPWVADLPYFGAMFRRVEEENNEIELLILVTPELVDAMDPHEVPPGGPGLDTASPNDWQLYMRGHIEVPRYRPAMAMQGGLQYEGALPGEVEIEEEPLPGVEIEPSEPVPAPQPPAASSPSDRSRAGRVDQAPARMGQYRPYNRQNPSAKMAPGQNGALPGFLGPIGYDVAK